MFEVVNNTKDLADLAFEIWHEYWTEILTPEQIDYMVEKFQSENAINNQIKNEKYIYYYIEYFNKNVGYFGMCPKDKSLFLSKIYIKKDFRHMGLGTKTFKFIKEFALNKGFNSITLTVNKYNTNTIFTYKKWGFRIIDSVITDIGNNFVMDDYIMEYKI